MQPSLQTGNASEELIRSVKAGDAEKTRRMLRENPFLARVRDAGGASAILLAIYHGHPELVADFIEAGAELDFWEACAAGRGDRVVCLLERDPGLVNELSADGYPPLGLAIFFGHDSLAELLIERGADINAESKNAQRVTPLHAAVARRNARMARLLLERGAQPDAVQAGGFTPLHSAAFHGDREIAETLLAHGANAGLKTADGKTAAELASERGHAEFAAWLGKRVSAGDRR